ncbi:MAG: amidohydrolase family protein [Methanomicrobiales archaeon]|nr:amidohydrolase family protein [Methanomicrobiales archaeon]
MRPVFAILMFLGVIILGCGCVQQGTDTIPAPPAPAVSTIGVPPATPSPLLTSPVTSTTLVTSAIPTPPPGMFIDTHAHIRPSSMSFDQVIQLMDRNNISRMIIMEPPGDMWISGAQPSSYGIPDARTKYPDRFSVLFSGEAGVMLYKAAKSNAYTHEEQKKFSDLLDQALASGNYQGIGEIGLRHLPPPGMPATYDITVPADHPWLFIMSDAAAKYRVPLDIHLQAGDTDITALERLLDHNPDAIIIWDHAGDHTQNMSPDTLRPLLAAHKNLYTSIKVRTGEKQGPGGILKKDGVTLSEPWKQLITDYPDRFIIGTDVKLGIRPDEIRYVKDHTTVLSQLPQDVAKKVAQENPRRIFRL